MDLDLWALSSEIRTRRVVKSMGELSPSVVTSPQMLLVMSRAEASDAALIAQLHTTPTSSSGLVCQLSSHAVLLRHPDSLSELLAVRCWIHNSAASGSCCKRS